MLWNLSVISQMIKLLKYMFAVLSPSGKNPQNRWPPQSDSHQMVLGQ